MRALRAWPSGRLDTQNDAPISRQALSAAYAARFALRDVASRSIWEIGDRRENVIPNAAQHELDLLGCPGDFQDNRDAVPFMFDFRHRPWLPVE